MSRGRRHAALLALALVAFGSGACRDAYSIGQFGGNAPPFAHAGTGSSYPLRTEVTVDGAASFDPDGAIVTYRWRIAAAPGGTQAQLADPDTPRATLTLDLPGRYVVELTVTDDAGARSTSRVEFEAVAPALTATAGPDLAVPWLGRAQLEGALSVEGPDAATFTWELVERPPTSFAVLTGVDTLTPTLETDVEGTYRARLVASTAWSSVTDEVTITARSTPRTIARGAFEFTYVPALDRILALSYPITGSLLVIDPSTGEVSDVALPTDFAPYELAVAPDGARAAATDGTLTVVVDVAAAAVEQVLTLPYPNPRLAFGPDGRLYVLRTEGADIPLAVIDPATLQTTETAFAEPIAEVAFRPGTSQMYTSDGFDGRVRRFDARGAVPLFERVAEDSGETVDGALLISEDGATLVVGTGTVYRLADDVAADLAFIGSLPDVSIALSHSPSTGALAVLTIHDYPRKGRLLVVDATTLAPRRDAPLPDLGDPYIYPQLTAYQAGGARLYVVMASLDAMFIYDLEAP